VPKRRCGPAETLATTPWRFPHRSPAVFPRSGCRLDAAPKAASPFSSTCLAWRWARANLGPEGLGRRLGVRSRTNPLLRARARLPIGDDFAARRILRGSRYGENSWIRRAPEVAAHLPSTIVGLAGQRRQSVPGATVAGRAPSGAFRLNPIVSCTTRTGLGKRGLTCRGQLRAAAPLPSKHPRRRGESVAADAVRGYARMSGDSRGRAIEKVQGATPRVPRWRKAASSGASHDINLAAQGGRRIPRSGYPRKQRGLPRVECSPSSSPSSWELALRAGVAVHNHVSFVRQNIRPPTLDAAGSLPTALDASENVLPGTVVRLQAQQRSSGPLQLQVPGRGRLPPPPPNLGALPTSRTPHYPQRGKRAGCCRARHRQNDFAKTLNYLSGQTLQRGPQLTCLPNTFHTPRWPARFSLGRSRSRPRPSGQRLKRRGLRAELLRWARPATVPPELLLPKATRGQTIVRGGAAAPRARPPYAEPRYWQRA
jgi:hypothetical protein